MENFSTLSRDKVFRKRAYVLVFFITFGIIALYGLIYSAESFFGGTQPGGISGSSYATIENGTRAWSELLYTNGYEVVRDRGRANFPLIDSEDEIYKSRNDELVLNRKTQTVVILGGALPSDEQKELKTFLDEGGRLITDNPYILDQLLDKRIEIIVEGYEQYSTSNESVSILNGVNEVKGSKVGSFLMESSALQKSLIIPSEQVDESNGKNKEIVGAGIFRFGSGDIVAMPDALIVSNGLLDQKDNALFSLLIAGNSQSQVTFIEGVHGYSDATGFAGMPLNWRVAIVGLFVAFVIFASAKGRRFGVGEEPDRNLGPRRIYIAYAITQAIKRSKK